MVHMHSAKAEKDQVDSPSEILLIFREIIRNTPKEKLTSKEKIVSKWAKMTSQTSF